MSAWWGGGNRSVGGCTYGIRIGKPNRDRYFEPSWTTVEVEIDGIGHRIPITGGFWKKCPELRHPAIRSWLKGKGLLDWPKGRPPKFELVVLVEGRFQLEDPAR